jgi:hypothetical protein
MTTSNLAPNDRGIQPPHAPWPQSCAPELAQWAAAHLVNRADVWGGYLTPRGAGEKAASYTRPAKDQRGSVTLALTHLERHFAGRAGCIMGLHTTSPAQTSRWFAFDVDAHGPTADPARNWRDALALAAILEEHHMLPLIEDSNGAGGYHVWVILDAPLPTARAYAFARDVLARTGLACETFPKQTAADFGNWLRLPGRHHTLRHWSRFWSGTEWRSGADAARALLTHPITSADAVPLPPPSVAPRRTIAPPMPTRSGAVSHRVAAYVARLPNHAAGEGRNLTAYRFAAWLVRDLALPDAVALPWLRQWDSGNHPPLGDELLGVLRNVRRYGRRAFASGLERSRA